MKIKKIYEYFDKIGSLSFSTVDKDGYPQTRIAHFFAYDDDGLYFRTMTVKPFYRELKDSGRVAAGGLFGETAVTHDEDNLPHFEPGYTVRVTGDVRELTEEEVKEKASNNRDFNVAVYDINKYPETKIFVIYRGKGEIYNYDFNKLHMDHKIQREGFDFGGLEFRPRGLVITDKCIKCGKCTEKCTHDAIIEGETYKINEDRCDRCGNCFHSCPANAIICEED